MTSHPPLSSPGVRFPPPIIFVAGILASWILDRHWHALPIAHDGGPGVVSVGVLLVLSGISLAVWGVLTFRRARTAIIPSHSASQLVVGGPYRFTRNPMYTGLTIVYYGVTVLLNSLWPFLLAPLVFAALVRFVIAREEAYLHEAFGAAYAAYQTRVRRWI